MVSHRYRIVDWLNSFGERPFVISSKFMSVKFISLLSVNRLTAHISNCDVAGIIDLEGY